MYKYTVTTGDSAGLNAIAKKHGFANYKEAGVTSVPSGNFDLIRPGDIIEMGNYDPNKITTIQKTTPVISSTDNAQQFRDNSTALATQVASLSTVTKDATNGAVSAVAYNPDAKPFGKGDTTTDATGKTVTNTTGDPILDKVNAWQSEQNAKFDAEAQQRKDEYSQLFTTQLANIDAAAKATIDGINATYDKRIKEEKRINTLNIDRVKAYGLGNGGQYTPVDFGSAISEKETEAADHITALENERTNLIAQAKQAQANGQSGLLRQKMADIDTINNNLRTRLNDVAQESEKQYQLLRTVRQEAEAKQKAALAAMKDKFTNIAPKYVSDFDKMDDAGKDAFITKISTQTGLDYGTIFGIMHSVSATETNTSLEQSKKLMDIAKTKVEINSQGVIDDARRAAAEASRASAAKAYNDIAVKKEQTRMDNEIPSKFKDDAAFQAERSKFVKKWGVTGQKYWDAIFLDPESGTFTYDKEGASSGKSGDPLGLGI